MENNTPLLERLERVIDTLSDNSIKMGTISLKHNGEFFDVVFRNISGNTFAFSWKPLAYW